MNRAQGSVLMSILLVAAVVGACGDSTPTQPPPVTPQATASTASLLPQPSATPTPAPTVSPTPSPSPSSTPAPSPTSAPTGSAAQAGSVCSGTSKFKAFFTAAAKHLRFAVYCAVLPADYWIQQAEYQLPNNGWIEVDYENARGFQLAAVEGYGCPSTSLCLADFATQLSKFLPLSGRIWLGDQVADLYVMKSGGPGGRNVYYAISHPRYGLYYVFAGMGMTQRRFEILAKALVKVPKP